LQRDTVRKSRNHKAVRRLRRIRRLVEIQHPHAVALSAGDASAGTTSLPRLAWRTNFAFIPDALSAEWTFPQELWPLLVKARESLGTLNGIGQTLPNPELLLRRLQNREAITSSSMEGTYVTPQQLLLYELDPREPRSTHDKMADWREVFNYSQALKHGVQLLQNTTFCNHMYRAMHGTLLEGVRGRDKLPGQFRNRQVFIGDGERYIPPPPLQVEPLMADLERYIRSGPAIDPLVNAFLFHYQFEAIHPFLDGNGRIGRVILALMIQNYLGHSMPWLYMSAYFERHKQDYIRSMFNVSAKGEWKEWIELCLRGVIDQCSDSVSRCRGFKAVREEYLARIKAKNPTTRSSLIIEGLFTSPVLTIAGLAKQLDVEYATARTDVNRLIDAQILVEMESSRPKAFYAREIFGVAYGDLQLVEERDLISSPTETQPPSSQSQSDAIQ
jgi:Fic family protein